MHGIIMVFFFLIPSIPAVLGNFLVPLMIGARDLAFPRLNLLSWYIFIVRRAVHALGGHHRRRRHRLDVLHAVQHRGRQHQRDSRPRIGIFITGFSSILTGLNFIVTIHRMRAPGLTWFRLPLFVWAHYATSIIMVLGTPVIAITLLLVGARARRSSIGIFDPALGGDPVLFQHLFWFYSHPAVYIMILPSMGVISEIITCFSRKGIFGYSFIAISSLAIAVLGFLVWGHHMFVSGQSVYAALIFSVLSFAVAIPSAVKVFNWTATLYKGSISFEAPMLYALGFIGLFTIGGLTGLFLASLGLDVHVHDTYFVVAHFHYIMVGGAIMGYLGGIHYWWPKITGRMYPEVLAADRRGADRLHRLQPDVLPAVHPRLPRHAAALPRVSRGVSGAERDVDRRRVDPRRRLPAAADLPALVAALRRGGAGEPVARGRARVADAVAAADRELRPRRRSSPRTRTRTHCKVRGGARLADHGTLAEHAFAHQFDDAEQQHEASTLGMWMFLAHRGHVLRRPVHRLRRLPLVVPGGVRDRRATTSTSARHLQHRRADRQQPDHGAGGARRADRQAPRADALPRC